MAAPDSIERSGLSLSTTSPRRVDDRRTSVEAVLGSSSHTGAASVLVVTVGDASAAPEARAALAEELRARALTCADVGPLEPCATGRSAERCLCSSGTARSRGRCAAVLYAVDGAAERAIRRGGASGGAVP